MPYDVDFREADCTTVDTLTSLTAIGGSTPGNFQVPGNVSRITEIRVSALPEYTADAMYGFSSAVHLMGAGLKNAGFYAFPGPCGGTTGAATFSAGIVISKPEVYHVNIPVVPGGEIQAQGLFMGEACGAGVRIGCTLVYDGIPGKITDVDYRECNLTAANAEVTLTDRGGATVNSFKTTGKPIIEVRCNGGVKLVAGLLAAISDFHVYGAGLVSAGNYRFTGHAYGSSEDIASGGGSSVATNSVRYITNIALKAGNLIDVEAMMIEDDVGTIFAICALCYA